MNMFNKNIQILEKVNKNLATKLKQISIEEASKHVSALKNENNEILLVCDEKYVDDTPSPIASAKAIYKEQIKSATTMHDFIIVFGLGIGNLFDYTFSKSIANIIVFEPDINIIRFTFEYVDMTKYFKEKRCFITNDINECVEFIENRYLLDDKLEFVFLKNHVLTHPSKFTFLTEKLYEACQRKIIDMNTIKEHSKTWVENTFKNISNLRRQIPLNVLENKFLGKTALILGAGPSLKDNIELIKKNRDKFVIFTLNRTLETLRNNGITPDFCVVVDTRYVESSLTTDEDYLKEICFITDIKSDNFINTLPIENRFTYYPTNNSYARKLHELMLSDLPLYETGGTSSICAYFCSKILGFKNIIFAGIDLAFKDDTVYCDGTIAVANDSNSIKMYNNTAIIEKTKIKSINGKYIETRIDYAMFAKQFELFFAKNTTSNIYNLTSFGALIKGMKYVSLDNIVKYLKPIDINVKNILEESKNQAEQLNEKIQEKTNQILLEEKNKIIPLLKEINEWYEMYEKHPSFFEYATNIITKITSAMILQEYIQIELLKFTKLVMSKDNNEKHLFLEDLFIKIKNYAKCLDNLI